MVASYNGEHYEGAISSYIADYKIRYVFYEAFCLSMIANELFIDLNDIIQNLMENNLNITKLHVGVSHTHEDVNNWKYFRIICHVIFR